MSEIKKVGSRIGLYGGTFDPVHSGHLKIAGNAVEKLNLEKLIFLPTASPPHKPKKKIAPPLFRFNMVKLAIRKYDKYLISDYELHKNPAYTIDTVIHFLELFSIKKSNLFLLIGADNMKDIEFWKKPEEIFDKCNVVVAPRGEKKIPDNKFTERIIILDSPLINISSTEIRNRIKSGSSLESMVPQEVDNYIRENNLYLE